MVGAMYIIWNSISICHQIKLYHFFVVTVNFLQQH